MEIKRKQEVAPFPQPPRARVFIVNCLETRGFKVRSAEQSEEHGCNVYAKKTEVGCFWSSVVL